MLMLQYKVKKGINEHKSLVSMIGKSEATGSVIDRRYESFNNIAHFQERNWNYIIRSKESYSIKYENPDRYRWIQTYTTFDFLLLLPRENKMYDLKFSIIRFKIVIHKFICE